MDKAFGRIQEFMRLETSGGIILMIAAVFAMIIANTPLAAAYDAILGTYIKVGVGSFEIAKPAILWINDGLMAFSFSLWVWKSNARFWLVNSLALTRQFYQS